MLLEPFDLCKRHRTQGHCQRARPAHPNAPSKGECHGPSQCRRRDLRVRRCHHGRVQSHRASAVRLRRQRQRRHLSIYSVDPTTGGLRARGYVLTGSVPRGVALSPVGSFIYVADETSDDIAAYTADLATGQLSPIPGGPFAAGTGPYAVTVDPSGRFAYVANDGSDNVSGFAINPTTGALAPIVGSPFPTGHVPRAVTVHPSGAFAFVLSENVSTSGTNVTVGNVSAYRVDSVAGTLAPIAGSPFPVGVSPFSMILHPTGRFLYVANTGANLVSTISAFTVDPTSGALSQVPGSPFPAGTDADALAMGASGAFLYVANAATNQVISFAVASTGALTRLPGAVPTGTSPGALTVDPSGAFLYSVNFSNDVSVFTVNPVTGALSPSATVRARFEPTAMAVSGGATTVTYSPQFLYGASESGLLGFSVNASTGALAPLTSSPFTAAVAYDAITTDLNSRFCYATAPQKNAVAALAIDAASGALVPVPNSPFATGGAPSAVATDPSGRFAFVANSSSNDLSAFTIDAATGGLSPIPGSPYPTGVAPYTVTIDPTGRFTYVGSYLSGTVTGYAIDARTGELTPAAGSPFAGPTVTNPPFPMQLGSSADSSGRYVYFTSSTAVYAYAIDGRFGSLTPIPGSPFPTGLDALGVLVSPSQSFAYVGAFSPPLGNDAAFAYSIGLGGALAELPGSPFPGPSPFDIAYGGVIDASGRFLYFATDFDETIVAYAIAPSTGAVSSLPGSPFATRGNLVALTATATVQ